MYRGGDLRAPLRKRVQIPEAAQDEKGRYCMQPGRKRGIAMEGGKTIERANERFLGEVLREGIFAREPEGQAVHAVHKRVIQRALCGAIPGADAGNEL